MVSTTGKAAWRFVSTTPGALSVTMAGVTWMPGWPAGSWDSLMLVPSPSTFCRVWSLAQAGPGLTMCSVLATRPSSLPAVLTLSELRTVLTLKMLAFAAKQVQIMYTHTYVHIYTSDEGESTVDSPISLKKGHLSIRHTSGPLSHSSSSVISKKRIISQQMTKWLVPKCPFF